MDIVSNRAERKSTTRRSGSGGSKKSRSRNAIGLQGDARMPDVGDDYFARPSGKAGDGDSRPLHLSPEAQGKNLRHDPDDQRLARHTRAGAKSIRRRMSDQRMEERRRSSGDGKRREKQQERSSSGSGNVDRAILDK